MAWTYHNKPPLGWPLDLSEPINKGLVGNWLMNESSGNKIFDLSGNGGTGTLSAVTWVPGKYGPALTSLTGVIKMPATYRPIDLAKEASIIVSTIPQTPIDTDPCIFTLDNTNRFFLRIDTGGADDWAIFVSDGTDSVTSNTGNITAYGTRVHLVLVFRANDSLKLYIDGVEKASIAATNVDFIGASTSQYNFFNRSSIDRDYKGDLDFASIYKRALSASEIALLYRFPWYGFLNPDEIPILDQYYTEAVGGIVVLRRRRECA